MTVESIENYIVPDVLEPGLTTVFCGRAPSPESARRRAYYAHFSNKFWEILAQSGLTDRQLKPEEFPLLASYGIGLTDINKLESGSDHELSGSGDNPWALQAKIERFQPRVLAFNGKNNFRMYSHAIHRTAKSVTVKFGEQSKLLSDVTEIWVLPNTSARARASWDSEIWFDLAKRHTDLRSQFTQDY